MAREFEKTIRFRTTARSEARLAKVAKLFDRKPSQVLRQLIDEAYTRHFSKKPAEPAEPNKE